MLDKNLRTIDNAQNEKGQSANLAGRKLLGID